MSNSRTGQSIINVAVFQSPNRIVGQSYVQIAVLPALTSLTIVCNNPPSGAVNVIYSHTLGIAGGTPPFTVAITAGALPTGLSIAAATGVISGTPTVAGTFNFTATVTDSIGQTAAVSCSISITTSQSMQPPQGGGGAGGHKRDCCIEQPPVLCVNELPEPKGDCGRGVMIQSVFRRTRR